jgi:hypothetical protein
MYVQSSYPLRRQGVTGISGGKLQKVRHQFLAFAGEDAFGVELDSFDGKGFVAESHDDAGAVFIWRPGADFEVLGQGIFFYDEGVVAGGGHGRRESGENGFAVVLDGAGFAVHEVSGADDLASEGCADGLVTEADAEQGDAVGSAACAGGNSGGEMTDEVDADAGFLGSAGSGRDDDAVGAEGLDFSEGDFIVAADFDLSAQFSEILDEVVGEGIVVVEDEDHLCTECKDLGLQGLGEKASGQRLSLSEFRSGQTSGRPLLEKREKWRTPQLFRSLLNRQPGLYSAEMWASRLWML